MSRRIAVAVIVAIVCIPVLARAQEKPAGEPTLTPVKVQLVLSRYQGEKKISSMPYTLWVSAPNRAFLRSDRLRPVQLRMGAEVPVPTATFVPPSTESKEPAKPITSWNYKNVGTQIDASAAALENGRFRLDLSVSQNALYTDESAKTTANVRSPRTGEQPVFTSFTSSFVLVLRDGETGQYLSATDPATGEVLRVDATLTVLK